VTARWRRALLVVVSALAVLLGAVAPTTGTGAGAATAGRADAAFLAVPPARLADTRPGAPTVDGRFSGPSPVGPDTALVVQVAGRAGIAWGGATAVALNLTTVDATAPTHLTVYPTWSPRPTSSNLNPAPGRTATNMVVAKLGPDGTVSVYNAAGTIHVIVDLLGWFPTGGGFAPLDPARLADTRPGEPTVDGRIAGTGAVAGGTTLQVPVRGRALIAPTGVSAVALNVTAVFPTAPTHLTVYPNGGAMPGTSNLNPAPGAISTNMVIAKVGADGAIAVFNAAGATHVIVDVLGWFPDGAGSVPITPARLADTRPGSSTVDGRAAGTGAVGAAGVLRVPVPGRAGVPGAGVGTVALNITAVDTTAPTYLAVYPTGTARPATSNLNPEPGRIATNVVMTRVGEDGTISVYNAAGSLNVIVDVLGWYPGTPGGSTGGRWVVPTGRPVRVQFVGDSITEGVAKSAGGLASVPSRMRASGFDVALVGTLADNGIGHDGHGGSCIDDRDGRCLHSSGFKGEGLLQSTPGWAQQAGPDVIVINAGNNDRYVLGGWSGRPDLVADAMGRLIDTVAWWAPQALIAVTRLESKADLTGGNENGALNDLYARVVAERAAAGRNVAFIDAYRQVTSVSDFSAGDDMVHLSETGCAHYAQGVAQELQALFNARRS